MNDHKFLRLAFHIAQWSKDPSTKVGCILVNRSRVVVGMGFNGFPRRVQDVAERYENRALKYMMVQHAELNAIFNATEDLCGCSAFITHPPCSNCAGALIQVGISRIVTTRPEPDIAERFKDSFAIARMMLTETETDYKEVD